MPANTRKFNTLTVSSGAIYRKFNLIGVTEAILDIDNDFRCVKLWTMELEDIISDIRTKKLDTYDFDNDIRLVKQWLKNILSDVRTVKTILSDISNDIRLYGEIEEIDILNDIRLVDFIENNIVNDIRVAGQESYEDILNDFRTMLLVLNNINNKISTSKLSTVDLNNNIKVVLESIENDVNNVLVVVMDDLDNINNDVRSKKLTISNVTNDIRTMASDQDPDVGFQSKGKEYVKVYIDSVEQTDVDVDSINISQVLNDSWVASFDLGRAYDSSKPNDRSVVEIKYDDKLLYKGYIVEVSPNNDPESIRITCQDEYWNLNKTKKYFFVGRKPADTNEYYYENIKEALNALGFNYDIGNFIPKTMDLYGYGVSDAITNLVQNSGNFAWFINQNGTKILWEAGRGNIIDLPPQKLGINLGLYQVIKHNIKESVIGLINKLRVQMGNWTIKQSSDNLADGSGSKTYYYTYYTRHEVYAVPAWDNDLEVMANDSADGYGYDLQDPDKDYSEVFRKFYLPSLNPEMEAWVDRYPPLVEVQWGLIPSWNNLKKYMTEGFSIDYGFQVGYDWNYGAEGFNKPSITFSEPQVVYDENSNGQCYRVRPKIVKLYLWKEHKFSYTLNPQVSPDDEPDATDNPLMFYTDKMGSYSDTIIEDLNLADLSIQEGYIIKDDEGNIIENIPSWDDTDFAEDYANWQLSKTCDKKYTGSIDLTIDAMLYYNIDLSKRIKIEGVVDAVNIKSINYNFNNFIATIELESNRYWKRTISYPPHGE